MIAPASGGTELGGGLTVAPRTLTLLLVEDNPDDAALYQGYLRRELGATYAVSIAATGAGSGSARDAATRPVSASSA